MIIWAKSFKSCHLNHLIRLLFSSVLNQLSARRLWRRINFLQELWDEYWRKQNNILNISRRHIFSCWSIFLSDSSILADPKRFSYRCQVKFTFLVFSHQIWNLKRMKGQTLWGGSIWDIWLNALRIYFLWGSRGLLMKSLRRNCLKRRSEKANNKKCEEIFGVKFI